MDKPTFKAAHFAGPAPQGAALSPRFEIDTADKTESAADRILLTLLALGLMLLAFFVVLTSSASYDQRRARDVMQSMQAVFVPAKDDVPKNEIKNAGQENAGQDGQRLAGADLKAAVGALRAAVSDVFSGILPRDVPSPLGDKNRTDPDRVEIDVPMSVFFAADEAVLFPLPALVKLVDVLNTPPAGYRMELVVRAAGEIGDLALDQARIASMADGLVRHGLAPTALSVGTLQNAADTGAADVRSLRFTFLLLTADDDHAAVRMMTGKAGR